MTKDTDNMRVLFLDIDGVLNSRLFLRENHDRTANAQTHFERSLTQLDPVAVRLVSDFADSFDLRVVISSTWRRMHSLHVLHDMLRAKGWEAAMPIDITPTFDSSTRGEEIAAWLHEHSEATNHVILDDDSDFHEGQHLVRTSIETGVTHEHIDIAIGFLI
jgi:hypothetical protein